MRRGRAGEAAERVWPLAALTLAMLILGAAAASGHLFRDANPSDGSPVPTVSRSLPTDFPTAFPTSAAAPADNGGVSWLAILVALALVALAVLLAAALFQWLARRHTGAPAVLLEPREAVADSPSPEMRDELLEQARFAQAEVRAATDIRDAVIAAYVGFEGAVARGGVAKLAHETSGDLLRRVLRSTAVPASAAADLVALYERVRFGTQGSDETMRQEAQRCLGVIEQSLAGASR